MAESDPLSKDEILKLMTAQICRFANVSCMCMDKSKPRMCSGPSLVASRCYDLLQTAPPVNKKLTVSDVLRSKPRR